MSGFQSGLAVALHQDESTHAMYSFLILAAVLLSPAENLLHATYS